MSTISTTRRVLAIMAVTTALCADQAAMAAPSSRPQPAEIAQLASRLVTRLVQNFQRNLPAAIRPPANQQRSVHPLAPRYAVVVAPLGVRPPSTPFQFRLPPPAI